MRPLDVILSQLRHDARFDAGRFAVRYVERAPASSTMAHSGAARVLREEPLRAFWVKTDVPQHRVRQLVCDGRIVWDRDDGTDLVASCATVDAGAAGAAGAVHVVVDRPARFGLWNLSARCDEADVVDAACALVDRVDVCAFVECGAAVRDACAARGAAVHATPAGDVVIVVRDPARHMRATPLPLPGRDALVVDVDGVTVVAAHFTSNVRGDRAARRAAQRDALRAALPATGVVVVLVDANDEVTDGDAFAGFVDKDAGPTFFGDHTKPPRRLDHALVRGVNDVGGVDVVVDRSVNGSDHWPVLLHLPHTPQPAKDRRTALAIVLDADAAASVDAVRAMHDRAAARWPAHINLVFPFVRDDDVWAAVARAVVAVPRHTLTLGASIDVGRRSRAASVIAHVDTLALRAAIDNVVDGVGVTANSLLHCTLASDGSARAAHASAAGVNVVVDAVCVLVADDHDGAYRVVERCPLGPATLRAALTELNLLDTTTPPGHAPPEVAAALQALPGTWRLCGSSARGVRFTDSDVDVAWTPPPDLTDPLDSALALLGGVRTDAVAAPRIKTTLAGVEVDIVVGGDDAVRAARTPLSPAALWALRALRTWARQRGLRNAANNGMPSSIAWHGLVNDAAARIGVDIRDNDSDNDNDDVDDNAAALVRAVFAALADARDTAAVSGTGFRGVTPAALARLREEARRARRLVDVGTAAPAWRALFTPAPLLDRPSR